MIQYQPRFSVHDYWMAKYFTVAGSAIAYMPDFFTLYEVEVGALLNVLPGYRSEDIDVYALYPSYRHRNPRIMIVVEALCEHFDDFIRYPGYSLISNV